MKVVINKCFGGFSLSRAAFLRLRELGHSLALAESDGPSGIYCTGIQRNDPLMLKVLDELGTGAASGPFARLIVVEIPDGIEWEIDDYDGMESIAERHRSWG